MIAFLLLCWALADIFLLKFFMWIGELDRLIAAQETEIRQAEGYAPPDIGRQMK